MNKIKILALIALAAMLSACGSDNGSPPELVKNFTSAISPYDTLVVKFNSELVNIDTSGESNVVLNQGKEWIKRKTSGKELYFIGANTTDGGSHYFTGGKSDSIEFKNIKNSDGYIKDRTVFYFSTNIILDREPNNREEDANDVESFGNITEGITYAGVIDKYMGMNDQGFENSDTKDFYKFNLKRDDIISITISNKTTPLKVRFFGACYSTNKNSCNDKTDSTTTKKNSITLIDTVKTGHLQDSDLLNKVSSFYINIFENTSEKPNPYTVTVKKL